MSDPLIEHVLSTLKGIQAAQKIRDAAMSALVGHFLRWTDDRHRTFTGVVMKYEGHGDKGLFLMEFGVYRIRTWISDKEVDWEASLEATC